MSYNLQISSKDQNLNFHVKYEKLDKAKKPEVKAKAPNGDPVSERTVYQGKVLNQGDTQRQWVDPNGKQYSKHELTFWCKDEQVFEIQQTKVFEIEGFQPESCYTDDYVIPKYYEIFPSNNGMKKDIDRKIAERVNLSQMRRLWEHLHKNKIVARGEFCPASRGFLASDGYIRAIAKDADRWVLEVGVFKEEKLFSHMQEGKPQEVALPVADKKKKLKLV